VIGFLLAALIDQKIRFENTFRTIMLYPFALSFIVTGLVWQWILNPEFGVQSIVRARLGELHLRPALQSRHRHLRRLIAGLWQGSGLVMVLMLAGLRGIDEEIWKAARIDGIPTWKTYLFIVIPMMRPVFITTLVLMVTGIVRVYDLVVAQTGGGPGIATEVPAKYVYDYMFQAQNLGQGFAASTMMLLTVAIFVVPWAYHGIRRQETWLTPPHPPLVDDGPRGTKAEAQDGFSRRNIFLYGTLIVVAVYYLLPLYVMVVTSLKGMPEIRLGNIFAPPVEITFEPWVKAWAEACTGLNCDGSRRVLEFGPDHRALGDHLDRDRLGERLRARQLAFKGRMSSSPS
jgi:ABC-type glycerol-3-phosphate transport system permease component